MKHNQTLCICPYLLNIERGKYAGYVLYAIGKKLKIKFIFYRYLLVQNTRITVKGYNKKRSYIKSIPLTFPTPVEQLMWILYNENKKKVLYVLGKFNYEMCLK
jgi:hypothetical protein